jgi:hypothetical protein
MGQEYDPDKLEEMMSNKHREAMIKAAHGDTPPGFARKALIDDPETSHVMEEAEQEDA